MDFWMVTLAMADGRPYTIVIDSHPADWLIKWGNHNQSNEKHIVFAMPITKDQYDEFDGNRQ